MDGKDNSIQKYMAFLTTVDTGSFTKAAEKLHYSQSGISRMIGDLETEWHVVLLSRDRNGVSLTSDGALLLPYARSVVNDYRKLQMQVDELSGLKSGMIRIGTFSSVATHWLPKIIKAFQADYPAIDYELLMGDYEEIEQWVMEGRVDCGFTKLPADPSLETIFLAQDPYLAVVPGNFVLPNAQSSDGLSSPDDNEGKHEAYPLEKKLKVKSANDRKSKSLAKQAVFPVEALEQEPFLLLEHGKREEVTEFLEKNKLHPKIHFTTWDDYAIMSMVEMGLGISVLPKLILQRVPYRIKMLPLSTSLTRNIGLILKSSKDASIATKTFLLYLKFRDDGAITDSLTGILKENDIEDCKAVALDHRFNKGI